MSCTKCKSSPCACADHGLTTPCSYPVCDPPSESCEEVVCAECVSYCGPTFQITNPADPTDIQFNVYTGDRLEEILQRIALYMVNPACADPDDHHSVWHVMVTNVTNDGVTVSWDGAAVFPLTPLIPQCKGINVYSSQTSGVWVLANTSAPLLPTETSLPIISLDPGTVYLFKVVSGTEIQVATLGGFTAGTSYVTGAGVICTGGSGTGLTVDIVASGLLPVASFNNSTLVGGSGYTTASAVATTGGGTGLTVDITAVAGAVTAIVVNDGGSGYTIGDTITVSGGGGNATIDVLTVNPGGLITSVILNNPGTDYKPGDVVNITGGDSNATVIVGTTVLAGSLCDSVEVQVTTLL